LKKKLDAGTPVFAKNCGNGCAFSLFSRDIPRCRSPPVFLDLDTRKFRKSEGTRMYYDQKKSGARIQRLRKQRCLTQERLAEKLNINASTLGRLERGRQGASIDLLIEMAMFFEVSLDYILLGRETQTDALKRQIHAMLEQLLELERKL
jgi:DNA-binding XRE family transcriptional regulator